jgi:hypothetical protein
MGCSRVIPLTGVYLTGVHLMGVYLINVYLADVHLVGGWVGSVILISENFNVSSSVPMSRRTGAPTELVLESG